jgi:hypothetical protein
MFNILKNHIFLNNSIVYHMLNELFLKYTVLGFQSQDLVCI